MSNVEIVEVLTPAQRRVFVDVPNVMYKDEPNFVPAFYGDDLSDWNPKKNPAFEYCEARAFLAYRDRKVVGRIGAILSHRANEKFGKKRMRFSQVDFIDDPEVSAALFQTVENWAKEKGMNEMHGPLGFCDLDREGMLVEGYDRRGMFITYYNRPYYNEHLARLGYEKDTDWVEYLIPIPDHLDEIGQKFQRIAKEVLKRTGYHVVKVRNRSEYKPYIRKAFRLVNEAYAPLYGVVELGEAQIEKYADKFIPLINPDYCCLIVNDEDDLLAFGVCAPSMAEAMKKHRGRLFPLGWIDVLRSLKKNDTVDLLLIAVRPDLQGTALNAVVMDHLYESCIKNGIRHAETGPQLETNRKVLSQWKMFHLEPHKRRRCYHKILDL
ncbi:MAG: hypothetical protein IJL72_09655 [Lachnospiraceae bacterium]|nr:hypothetical protein [Lachnospiraceae bacterium]